MNDFMRHVHAIESIETTLWIGSLLLAGMPNFDPFPDEVDALAREYFGLCKPVAKA